MDNTLVDALCTACELGSPLAEPQAVPGGQLHRIWRLSTTKGTYALKQLNAAITRQPDIRTLYQVAEKIAVEMANRGVPAVVALQSRDGVLQTVDESTILVYNWVPGTLRSPESVTVDQAGTVGKVLAQMHALSLSLPEFAPLEWKSFYRDDWDRLLFQAADAGLSWAHSVHVALPDILEWMRLYEEVEPVLGRRLVISHRHLEPGNVLWLEDQRFRIVDWESAGPIHPSLEVVNSALSWSGLTTGVPREDIFRAVLGGYRRTGGTIQVSGLDALHGCMGMWLGWLLFNMRRSLGEAVESEEERQLGVENTRWSLLILRSLAEHSEHWANWVDQC